MTYSIIGIIALLVTFIINFHVFRKNTDLVSIPGLKAYKRLLISIFAYFIVDIAWGFLDEYHVMRVLYFDTMLYFILMTIALYFWTRYVDAYLNKKSIINRIATIFSVSLIFIQIIILIINIFTPIMFEFDENNAYHAKFARYPILIVQVVMFILSAIHSFLASIKLSNNEQTRYKTITWSSFVMSLAIILQTVFPLYPVYSIAFLLGFAIIYTFIIEGELNDYKNKIHLIEEEKKIEVGTVKILAYTDSLTKVKNKYAYLEDEAKLDERISNGELKNLAVIVFDLNDLKIVNDTFGHALGDEYICDAADLICKQFKHSPVYRIGGDEFVALLEGDDFDNKDELLQSFRNRVRENINKYSVIISSGIAIYDPQIDKSYQSIFSRADKAMYKNKDLLKELIRFRDNK